ncbi:MAG: hypothetical protein CSA97_02965 [Bacteroidetes bacterium]|nr:MAG: hypothetical protein CSA97_02965 [Bacteroidota bacterium]
MSTYINPFTDFGFKRLFGQEENKDLLISFLNELLRGEQVIRELTYLKTEHLGSTQFDRRAIFDLYCENERGEKFIVELQRAKQKFFKDRTIFYSTFPIQQEAKPNDWDFRLRHVYTIAILDFVFDDDTGAPQKYRYDVKLMETELKEVFYDKLTFIYLLMPKFNKPLEELKTGFEKWLYAIKHLYRLADRPDNLSEEIFEKFFRQAEIAEFTQKEHTDYQDSLKAYNDWKNTLETAHEDGFDEGFEEGMEKGMEKGRQEGIEQMARSMLANGLNAGAVSKITGLSPQQIEKLEGE